MSDKADKEILRHVILEALAARTGAAMTVAGLRRKALPEIDFAVADADVEAALELLKDLGLVESTVDELGSTRWWRATAAGVLRVERGE